MENWAKINDKYSVSNMGRFWSVNIGIMKTPIMTIGYPHLNIRDKGKSVRVMCHVYVARHFIENPENKPQINHKNGIKHDNRVENLEWVTVSENIKHAVDFLGKKAAKNNHRRKTIIAYRDGLPIVIETLGIRQMARDLHIPYQGIQAALKNKDWSYFGWKFELFHDPKWEPKSK